MSQQPDPSYPQGSGPSYPQGSGPSYPQGSGPYGQGGPGPYGPGGPLPGAPAVYEPPSTIRRAAMLMVVRAVLGVIGLVLSVATIGSLRTQIRNSQSTLSASTVNALVNTSIVVTVVLGIAFAVLYVLLSRKLLQRRNWARIVTIVLSSLGVLTLLGSLVQRQTTLGRATSVVVGLCDLAILVFVLMKPSREYFQQRLG